MPTASFPEPIKGLDDTPFTIGKYKGKTPAQVADENPGYIVWVYENITDRALCTKALYNACVDAVESAKVEDSDMYDDDSPIP